MESKTCINDKIYSHRTNLHTIAEVGLKEYKTSEYIKKYLDKLEIEYEVFLETGIVGIIRGNNSKKNVAFRADMDGLVSGDGVEHLCGHDGHMSILLGLIEFISENLDKLNDNIVFIFQPAEEGPGGAKELIKEGLIEKYNIDEIYGLHIYPEIKEGMVGSRAGYFMASVGELDIEITAKSGHGAMPQDGIDGIVIASNVITSIQSIISRNVSPLENAVVTIGKIEGGVRRNIIAENIKLEGTIRAFNPDVYNNIKHRIRTLCRGIEVSYDCKINVRIKDDYPSVKNDRKLCEEFIEIIGKENFIELDPLMISEDFSYYQKEVPGLFFMLGSRNEEKGFVNGLHNINFNFDEQVLYNGVEVYKKLMNRKKMMNI